MRWHEHKRRLENRSNKKAGRNIKQTSALDCQLHGNELPLKHLLIHLDRKTNGTPKFTGPIEKLLNETNFENPILLILNLL